MSEGKSTTTLYFHEPDAAERDAWLKRRFNGEIDLFDTAQEAQAHGLRVRETSFFVIQRTDGWYTHCGGTADMVIKECGAKVVGGETLWSI